MNNYTELKDELETLQAGLIIREVRKAIEEKLPEDKTIETSTDEELGKAIDELKEEID